LKIRKQSFFVYSGIILILLISASCSQSSSDSVNLDTWLNRVELEEPFSPQEQTTLSARLDYTADSYALDSPASEMLEGSQVSGAVENVILMKGVIDTLKTALTEQSIESNQILTVNKVAFTMSSGDLIVLDKVKVVYDDSSFVTYITWNFRDILGNEGPLFYASLDVVKEDDGSYTTTIVSNSGDEGQNYFNYNNESGVLIYKAEDDIEDDYLIYTPTDLTMGYGNLRYIRLTDPAKDYQVIQYESDGLYLYEEDNTEVNITLFWDIDAGYQGVFTDTLPTSMTDLISGWVTDTTDTIATDLSIQALLPAIEQEVEELLLP